MYLAPNGQVFNAGPSQTTRFLDTSGTGAWTVVGNNTYRNPQLGFGRDVRAGKVLIAGGEPGTFYNSGSGVLPPTLRRRST